tara:strand:- start:157 stop:417 length:261 start_codon:yes stop_codon:yes gene_type:complete
MKIKADKNQTFKSFDIEMKPVTWQQRCELNDLMIKESGSGSIPNFSFWGKVVLEYTALTEDELNKYSTDEIVSIANAIFEEANKKK